MAPKPPCAKYQYVVTSSGPKILPVDEPACKDEESPADYNAGGYLPVKVNDTFKQGRYRVVRKLGWGHFSTVWLVKDSHTRNHSALKVVKSAGRYAETARDEIKLLSKVAAASPDHLGRAHIVSFLDSFQHQGPESSHICIVFEPLGENLLALIERNKKKGVSRALVKTVAKQILLGLQYLHDECDLVHTDIKPENILISIPDIEVHIKNELSQSPTPTSRRVGVPLPTKSRAGVTIPYNQQPPHEQSPISVKIADLGNATPSKKHYTEDIQTRQYRAPEAIVGRRDWDTRADVWSVACVVFELLTAEYLFDPQGQGELFTKDDDHMAQIIELLGDFPLEVKMGGKYSRELFDHNGALRYIRTLKPWPLKRVMVEKYLYSEEDAGVLCAFLEPMLAVDFRDRVYARDMVDHPWLAISDEEEPFEW
ncbi:hypothetical protein H1R20_g9931, partial [Candolleomyces eurysporus]